MIRVFAWSMRRAPLLLALSAAALMVQTFMPLVFALLDATIRHARHLSSPFELPSINIAGWLGMLPQAAMEACIPLGLALLIATIDKQLCSMEPVS